MKKMHNAMSKKISPLRTIVPSQETLSSIKATIDARIAETGIGVPKDSKKKIDILVSPYFRMGMYAASFFLFLFAFHLENPYMFSQLVTKSQMMRASHAHARAQVTLQALKGVTESDVLFNNDQDYEVIMRTVSLNQQTLDTLSLHGEKGLYSMDECLSDYTQYYHLLVLLDKKLEVAQKKKYTNHDALQTLRSQVHEALEEAEERLGSYPEDMENK